MNIKVINKSSNPLPSYATPASAGMDLRAYISDGEGEIILPGQRTLIHTGLYLEIPEGYEAQIRPRSGLALKHGITVLNTPGTIDADYRGEICVILANLGNESYTVKEGERIAQIVFAPVTQATLEEVSELSSTERGEGGFGHSGK